MEITVRHVSSGKERAFAFTEYNSDEFSEIVSNNSVKASSLWEKCACHFPLEETLALVLFHNEKFIVNGEERIQLSNLRRTVVYLLQVPPALAGHLHFDNTSISHALQWTSNECDLSDEVQSNVAHLSLVFSVNSASEHKHEVSEATPLAGNDANNNNVNNDNINNENNNLPARHWIFQWIRVSLIVRLAIFYFVFYHERDIVFEKKAMIIGGLVAVYLLQVGLFSSLYKQVLDRLHVRNDQVRAEIAVGQPRPNTEVFRGQMTMFQQLCILVEHLGHHGVYLPRSPGVLNDFFSLLISFFGSVFPGWNAYQLPPNFGAEPAAAAVPPENRPPNRGENNGNENVGFLF